MSYRIKSSGRGIEMPSELRMFLRPCAIGTGLVLVLPHSVEQLDLDVQARPFIRTIG